MSVSRRRFLEGGAAALAAAVVPHSPLGLLFPAPAGAAPGATATTSQPLTQATFSAYVDTPFRVSVASKPVDVVLIQVSPGVKPSPSGGCFSLLFTGSSTKAFASGTYTVTHASLGTFPLFIGPVGKPGKTMAYEAVFTSW